MVTVYHVNAFTKDGKGGNPAGVCLDAKGLSDQQMQSIAAKVGFSETAFVLPSKVADYRLRFFTPRTEVPLCGHATIATFHALRNEHKVRIAAYRQETYRQETNAGIFQVEVTDDNIYMTQKPPQFSRIFPKETIGKALNLTPGFFLGPYPEIVSTGGPTLIVPVASLEALLSMKPDFEAVGKLQARLGGCMIYLFTTKTILPYSSAHGRMFDPIEGINEESATGVASGAAACYMLRHGLLDDPGKIFFEQGYVLGRPSEILGSLTANRYEISRVIIGGKASVVKSMEI